MRGVSADLDCEPSAEGPSIAHLCTVKSASYKYVWDARHALPPLAELTRENAPGPAATGSILAQRR